MTREAQIELLEIRLGAARHEYDEVARKTDQLAGTRRALLADIVEAEQKLAALKGEGQ